MIITRAQANKLNASTTESKQNEVVKSSKVKSETIKNKNENQPIHSTPLGVSLFHMMNTTSSDKKVPLPKTPIATRPTKDSTNRDIDITPKFRDPVNDLIILKDQTTDNLISTPIPAAMLVQSTPLSPDPETPTNCSRASPFQTPADAQLFYKLPDSLPSFCEEYSTIELLSQNN